MDSARRLMFGGLLCWVWGLVGGCGGGASCPESRTLVDGTCECADGFVEQEGQCVAEEDTAMNQVLLRYPWNGFATGSVHATGNGAPGTNPMRPKFMWERMADAAFYQLQADDSCELESFAECAFESPELDTQVMDSFAEASERGVPDDVVAFVSDSDLPVSTSAPVGSRYFWRVRVCVAEDDCSAWSRVRYLDVGRLNNDYNGDGFGDLMVGAPEPYDAGFIPQGGRAVLYYGSRRVGVPEEPSQTVDNPTLQEGAMFGASVSEAGDINGDGYADAIVGAPHQDGQSVDEGAVFVFWGSASGISEQPSQTLTNPAGQTGSEFGTVAHAGDVNGDGYADVLVSAPKFDEGAQEEGNAFVYFGSPSGLGAAPNITFDSPENRVGAGFGHIAGAGDINGDGFADIAVGAVKLTDTSRREGRAYLYLGSTDGPATDPSATLTNPDPSNLAMFGVVAGGGDLNGDGLGDLLVGAPDELNSRSSTGVVFAYSGRRSGESSGLPVSEMPDVRLEHPLGELGARFGSALSGGQDVHGDGFLDVVVGAYATNGMHRDELLERAGAAYVFPGSKDGLQGSVAMSLPDPDVDNDSEFGFSVSSALDAQGDGVFDIAVGEPRHGEGLVHVFRGTAGEVETEPVVELSSPGNLVLLFGSSLR